MKLLSVWLLTVSLIFSPLAAWGESAAQASPAFSHAQRTMGRLRMSPALRLLSTVETENLRERVEGAAKTRAKDAAVGTGQTLLVMMTLAGVELVAQQIRKNGGGAPSSAQIAAISKTVANATVNSPMIWTSILASSGFSLASKPAQALIGMLKIPKLAQAFAPLLARSISSTIAFVGWDFGAQLWTEASLLLKSKEDYQIANDTFGMSKGLVSTALMARSTSQANQNRARVARQMMTNMILVLTVSNLRSQLFSNFVRNDLLTGEFQTMLASFIACGAIGTAIFPGAGTLVGLIFGAAGAVVAQFIPQLAKDRITNGYQFLRQKTLEQFLASNLYRLTHETSKSALVADFTSRIDLRSRWITIHWEQMHMEARAARADLGPLFSKHFEAMKQFYVSQLQVAQSLRAQMNSAEAKDSIARDMMRCSQMIQFFDALASAASIDPKNDEIVKTIEAASSRGFNETQTFIAWMQTA